MLLAELPRLIQSSRAQNVFKYLEASNNFDMIDHLHKRLYDPSHEVVLKLSLRVSCLNLASSFEESGFTVAGVLTKAKRSRTKAIRLNARHFVRFNFKHLESDWNLRFPELLKRSSRCEHRELVKDLYERINDSSIPTCAP